MPAFTNEGSTNPWFLNKQDLLKKAADMGMVVKASDSYEKLRQLVMAGTITDYEQRHLAIMEAARTAARGPMDQAVTPSLAVGAQCTGNTMPLAGHPADREKDANAIQNEATETNEATPDIAPMAVDQRALNAPRPGQPALEPWPATENIALAGLPKPDRCGRCGARLADGQCIFCKDPDGIAQ